MINPVAELVLAAGCAGQAGSEGGALAHLPDRPHPCLLALARLLARDATAQLVALGTSTSSVATSWFVPAVATGTATGMGRR